MIIKIFEGFAGYGGGSFALKILGIEFVCVGYSEIDKNAIKCYEQNHPGVKNYGDISKINPHELPYYDIFLGGFPCQDASIAGKRDLSKGRTNLYMEILRINEVMQPKMMVLENVAGLLSMGKKKGKVSELLMDKIVRDLHNIGYQVLWKKLNSKDYGIPQSRDRIWIVCIRDDIYIPFKYQYPEPEELKIFIKDILEPSVDPKYYLSEKLQERFKKYLEEKDRVVNLQPRQGKGIGGKGIISKNDGTTYCLDSGAAQGIVANRYRTLAGKGECYELREDQITNNLTGITKDNLVLLGYSRDSEGNTINLHPKEIFGTIKSCKRLNQQDLIIANYLDANMHKGATPKGFYDKSQRNIISQSPEIFDDYNSKFRTDGLIGTVTPNFGSSAARTGTKTITSGQLRRLTPKECFRLMGFLHDEINLEGLSDTAKYKLAGNGGEIQLASKVLKNMIKCLVESQ